MRKRFIDEVLTREETNIEAMLALSRNEKLENKTTRHIGFTHRES